jgi:hypothetical protein
VRYPRPHEEDAHRNAILLAPTRAGRQEARREESALSPNRSRPESARPGGSIRLAWLGIPLLLVALGGSTGCAAIRELFRDPTDSLPPLIEPDPLYEKLVPHYIELCAVSQYRPVNGKLGGSPGHAVMYLKGACKDEDAPYPRLRLCRGVATDTADPEHGVGVSVNRWLKNVNWVATPSHGFFVSGDVGTYELLDQARFDEAVERALELGIFDGVERHPKPGETAPADIREFVAEDSLGTDFGLRFGRTLYCARLPVEPEMLVRAMNYLNALNDEYANGEAEYEWSGYSDNCAHALHNALAAAGVWKPKSVRTTKLRQMFNLSVPSNTVVELAYLSNEYPIEDFDEIRGDALRWEGLTERAWLPAVPGALVETRPVLQVNALYETKNRLFVLGGWFRNDALKRAQMLFTDARFLQIDANLRYFHDRYTAILAERDADPRWTDAIRGEKWRRDREAYYAYIEEARELTRVAAERLLALDRAREELMRDVYPALDERVPSQP